MPRDALVAALCVPIDPLIVLDAAPLPGRAEVEAWPPVRLEVQPACVGLNACPSLSMPEIEEECATLVIGLGSGSVLGLGLSRARAHLARDLVNTDGGHERSHGGVGPRAQQHVRVGMVRLVKASVTQPVVQ